MRSAQVAEESEPAVQLTSQPADTGRRETQINKKERASLLTPLRVWVNDVSGSFIVWHAVSTSSLTLLYLPIPPLSPLSNMLFLLNVDLLVACPLFRTLVRNTCLLLSTNSPNPDREAVFSVTTASSKWSLADFVVFTSVPSIWVNRRIYESRRISHYC